MDYVIPSKRIEAKLLARGIDLLQIYQCFANRIGGVLGDTRERHQTNPPTLWLISRTDADRLLKVVFMHFADSDEIVIKSAYEPNQIEIDLYERSMNVKL